MGFAVAFRFEKVLEAWIEVRSELNCEEFELLAVGDEVGAIG